MNEITRKWIDVAIILSKDKNAKVTCPECQTSTVVVTDVYPSSGHKFDRYLRCDHCGKWSALQMSIPSVVINYKP